MASNLNEILGRNIDSVKSLKTAIKELQDSMVGLDTDSQEYKDTASKLSAAQNALNNTTKAGIEANLAAKDSIVGMQKEYNNLYDAYKKLSDEQRNSDIGKSMAESLSNLSESINNSKKEVGNFTSNIGQYAQGATEAFNQMGISVGALQTPMKLAAGGAKTLGASLKALIANPVGAVIMAIVVAFKAFQAIAERVKQAIQGNEETQNRLTEAMSVFRPVLDGISNAFDFLAKLTVKVIEGFSKVAEKVMSIIPGMKKAIDSHKDLAKATNDLTKAERENSVVLSQKQSEVETLRAEAAAATDATEKQQLLEEAKAKQMEIDQEYVNMAQEELRIMEEYAAKTANDAEANDKLAAAQKKVNDAIATGQKHQKEYNEQLKATTNEIKTQTSAVEDNREEAKKLYEQLVEDSKDEITQLTEKYEKEKKLLEKYHLDTKLLTKKYEQDKKEIVVNTFENIQNQKRASYTEELKGYSKYISLQRELLQDDQLELAKFEQYVTESIIERFNKISDAIIKTQDTIYDSSDGKNWSLINAFDFALNFGNVQNIISYSSAIDTLKKKIAEFSDSAKKAKGTYGREMYDNLQNALSALEKISPEEWKTYTEAIQVQIDSLRDAYGITIDNIDEVDLMSEIQEKRLENLKKLIAELPAQLAGEEQIKNIQDAIKENYVAELEGLIKTVSYDTFEGYTVFMAEQEAKALEVEKTAIEKELSNFSGTTEQKLEIMQRYYEVLAEMREKDQVLTELNNQRTTEMVNNLIDMTDNMGNAIGTIQSSYESFIDSQLKAGYIDEQEARKKKERLQKLEKWQTAFSIATIAADAAAGIFSIWKGYSTEVGVINAQTAAAAGVGAAGVKAALDAKSLVSAIAKTTSLAGTAVAQIAAARNGQIASNNNFASEGGSVGGGVGATPALMDSTPYTYSRTIQTTEEEERLNQPIIVRVSDILDGIETHNVQVTESTF